MNKINPESPAFPISATAAKQIVEGYGFPNEYLGLSIRAHIAAMFAAGMVANPALMEALTSSELIKGDGAKRIASISVVYTDALIEALNK